MQEKSAEMSEAASGLIFPHRRVPVSFLVSTSEEVYWKDFYNY
jgi:hypothetical protein